MRNLFAWNNTCGLKLIWMLFFRSGSIWVAWIRQKYLNHSPFWALNEKNNRYSWMFRKLLKMRHLACPFIRVKIGNGDNTFFWWDPWTPFGSLIHFIGSDGPSLLGIPLFHTVNEVISSNEWLLPAARSEKEVQLQAFISTLQITQCSDLNQWMIDYVVQKKFSSTKTWEATRSIGDSVPWHSLVWHKAKIPKHAFSVW